MGFSSFDNSKIDIIRLTVEIFCGVRLKKASIYSTVAQTIIIFLFLFPIRMSSISMNTIHLEFDWKFAFRTVLLHE